MKCVAEFRKEVGNTKFEACKNTNNILYFRKIKNRNHSIPINRSTNLLGQRLFIPYSERRVVCTDRGSGVRRHWNHDNLYLVMFQGSYQCESKRKMIAVT